MVIVGAIAAALAALMHVLIFLMESVWWRRERVWRRFGLRTQEQADTTQPLAYNQGFYNLFLAIGVAIGLILWCAGGSDASAEAAGKAVLLFALGSMFAAALVLTTTGRRYLRAAITQGTLPLLAFVLVALG